LSVIGERDQLHWLLRHMRVPFVPRGPAVEQLVPGDTLLLMTTRACYHTPGRDVSRVMASARVTSPAQRMEWGVSFAGRRYPRYCAIELTSLAPFKVGVPIPEFLDRLELFKDDPMWGLKLRLPLVELPPADAELLGAELAKVAGPPADAIDEYLTKIQPRDLQTIRITPAS
jgi:hypothetical protein